jgi:hypothetical protein
MLFGANLVGDFRKILNDSYPSQITRIGEDKIGLALQVGGVSDDGCTIA